MLARFVTNQRGLASHIAGVRVVRRLKYYSNLRLTASLARSIAVAATTMISAPAKLLDLDLRKVE